MTETGEGRKSSKVSRRQFLKVAIPAAVGGALVAEEAASRGFGLRTLGKILLDPNYRNKLGEAVSQGTIGEKAKGAYESQFGPQVKVELGQQVDMHEQLLDDVFSKYSVRKVVRQGSETSQLLLIGQIAQADVLKTSSHKIEATRLEKLDLTETLKSYGSSVITLPSSQIEKTGPDNPKPILYSVYNVQGKTAEFFEKEGGRKDRGGALVVTADHQLRACSANEARKYDKDNCLALETFAFSVTSENIENDINDINNTDVLAGSRLADNPRFDSFIVTFTDLSDQIVTSVISTYQPDSWPTEERLTIRQASDVCMQLLKENNHKRFTLIVPDPDMQSAMFGYDKLVNLKDGELEEIGGREDRIDPSSNSKILIKPYLIVATNR